MVPALGGLAADQGADRACGNPVGERAERGSVGVKPLALFPESQPQCLREIVFVDGAQRRGVPPMSS